MQTDLFVAFDGSFGSGKIDFSIQGMLLLDQGVNED
jgi:hypothetical protein